MLRLRGAFCLTLSWMTRRAARMSRSSATSRGSKGRGGGGFMSCVVWRAASRRTQSAASELPKGSRGVSAAEFPVLDYTKLHGCFFPRRVDGDHSPMSVGPIDARIVDFKSLARGLRLGDSHSPKK